MFLKFVFRFFKFILFSSFSCGLLLLLCGESVFCQCWVFVCLFVFRLEYFIYFLCFGTSSSFVLEKAFLVYFWCLRCFILFLRFFPLKRCRGTSSFFVSEKAFWLMLATVFAFHSIFLLLPPPSGFHGVQPQFQLRTAGLG